MAKQHFILHLIPPRPTFAQDMNEDERAIMGAHVEYWKEMMAQGHVVAFGPVLDPKGAYGLGLLEVDSEEQLKNLMDKDPSIGLNRYEYYPMMAVVAGK